MSDCIIDKSTHTHTDITSQLPTQFTICQASGAKLKPTPIHCAATTPNTLQTQCSLPHTHTHSHILALAHSRNIPSLVWVWDGLCPSPPTHHPKPPVMLSRTISCYSKPPQKKTSVPPTRKNTRSHTFDALRFDEILHRTHACICSPIVRRTV